MGCSAVRDVLGYAAGGELIADALLPYADHVAPQVVLLRDGSVMATYRASGVPFALARNDERNAHHRRHVAWLNAIADDNVEVVEHLVRHRHVPPMPPRPAGVSPYSDWVLGDYHRDLEPRLCAIDWLVSIRVAPRRLPLGLSTLPIFRRPATETREDLVSQLEQACSTFERILRSIRPVRLGLREQDGILFSEIMEALYLVRTTRFLPQPLVDVAGTLGDALYTDDAIFGARGFELRHAPNGADSSFGVMCGLRVYPRTINMARFDDLLELDGSLVLTNAIRFHTRAQAQDALELLRRQMVTAHDRALSDTDDLLDAIDAVASGREERGETRWSLALHADLGDAQRSLAQVDQMVSAAKNILANAGAKLATEATGGMAAYWAQLPGSRSRLHIRAASCTTRQFAVLSSLCGHPRGPETARWGGHLFRLATPAGTPFDWDLFVGDVGHTPILGPNGGGKTVLLGTCIAAVDALVRAKGGTQIVLDVDESNACIILALGGAYAAIRSGESSGVAPLRALPDTARSRLMLREFVAGLCAWNGGELPTPAERQAIADGVAFAMGEMAPEDRHFGVIRRFLGYEAGGAGERLEAWCQECGGENAWAFDGDRHVVDFDLPLVGVDLTQVMDDKHVMPPMATLLLWMASEVMDGRRCVVWAEEAPAYMPEPRFGRIFKGVALRARKRNAAFCPIAQMPEHLLDTEAGRALLKQARQMVLLPNDKASQDTYCGELGATEPEYRMVREGLLGMPARSIVVKRSDGHSSPLRFDLSQIPDHIAVLSSRPTSVRLMRDCIAKAGTDPAQFLPLFWSRQKEVAA